MGASESGRWLMLFGGALFVLGALLSLADRLPGFGGLPGDIVYRKGSFRLYVPLASCLLLSLLLTLLVALYRKS